MPLGEKKHLYRFFLNIFEEASLSEAPFGFVRFCSFPMVLGSVTPRQPCKIGWGPRAIQALKNRDGRTQAHFSLQLSHVFPFPLANTQY